MITLEEINRRKAEYDDYCVEYEEKCNKLQELSNKLKGNITEELKKCEQDKNTLYSKMIDSQKCYDETCRKYTKEKLSSMAKELQELFRSKHRINFETENWPPIIDELSKL
jgi:hypothetical protein